MAGKNGGDEEKCTDNSYGCFVVNAHICVFAAVMTAGDTLL